MAYYMVYWPQDRVEQLKKAGDQGPIKVVMGSIHSRMPTIVSIKVGDVVFPVTLMKKKLFVMARLPVTHRERAFDYCMRELGNSYSSLIPEGVQAIPSSEQTPKPHQAHQEPFNCCSQWAVWGEREVPLSHVPCLRKRFHSFVLVTPKVRKRDCG